MSLERHRRAVRNIGGLGGGSRLARPPQVLQEPDVRPSAVVPPCLDDSYSLYAAAGTFDRFTGWDSGTETGGSADIYWTSGDGVQFDAPVYISNVRIEVATSDVIAEGGFIAYLYLYDDFDGLVASSDVDGVSGDNTGHADYAVATIPGTFLVANHGYLVAGGSAPFDAPWTTDPSRTRITFDWSTCPPPASSYYIECAAFSVFDGNTTGMTWDGATEISSDLAYVFYDGTPSTTLVQIAQEITMLAGATGTVTWTPSTGTGSVNVNLQIFDSGFSTIGGWSQNYAATAGTGSAVSDIDTVIPAGSFILVGLSNFSDDDLTGTASLSFDWTT